MSKRVSRREFVTQSAVVAGAAIAAPQVLSAQSPNSTLGVAVIGVGGMGGYSVESGLAERIVAIADIDEGKIADAMKKIGSRQTTAAPEVFYDYRKMLDKCKKDIDVVLIATPDHNHAPAAIRAINMGKHCFCQKPLAHDIFECRALARAARRHKVLTQMGNQGHCGEGLRRACEYLWSGAIGNLIETHTILGRNFGGKDGRLATKPVPPGVHWDEWLGPAEYREYHENLHPFSWRTWRQFGTGTIGDMACHCMDAVFFATKVAEAKKLSMECLNTNGGSEEMWAQDNIVRYDVPARGKMPAVKMYVYDHEGLIPPVMKQAATENELRPSEATLFVGDNGMFWTTPYAGKAMILPRAHGGPIQDLFYCIKNGGTPCSNFPDAASPLTEFALLGHLAQHAGVGKVVEWDVRRMRCTNMPELNVHLRRRARRGWEV